MYAPMIASHAKLVTMDYAESVPNNIHTYRYSEVDTHIGVTINEV